MLQFVDRDLTSRFAYMGLQELMLFDHLELPLMFRGYPTARKDGFTHLGRWPLRQLRPAYLEPH